MVGLALGKVAVNEDDDDEGDDVERKRFGEVLKMVIEWPGPE